MNRIRTRPRIGIALGSGSARGWAHIGVLQALEEVGVVPDVVAGTSIGALVGAWYARGHLEASAEWVRRLTRRDVFSLMDIGFGGGVMDGRRLMELYRNELGDVDIEELPKPYCAVATNLSTGQEVWLQRGSLLAAVRASISLPGLFKPTRYDDEWLVDGGLVNPVPVSVCRAMGADIVIAVNLNGDLLSRHSVRPVESEQAAESSWWSRMSAVIDVPFLRPTESAEPELEQPAFLDVLSRSLNVMQDRITRSRLAGDPADIVLTPRLGHLELLDFARGDEAIREGRDTVRRALPLLEHILRDVGLQPENASSAPVNPPAN